MIGTVQQEVFLLLPLADGLSLMLRSTVDCVDVRSERSLGATPPEPKKKLSPAVRSNQRDSPSLASFFYFFRKNNVSW
jgi:hypothetical protein